MASSTWKEVTLADFDWQPHKFALRAFGISRTTLWRWRKKHPELKTFNISGHLFIEMGSLQSVYEIENPYNHDED